MNCKFCGGKTVKNGISWNKKQKFLCKTCGKTAILGNKSVKYSNKLHKLSVILMEEGLGFMEIARTLSKI